MKSSKNDILAVQLQASLPFMFPCQAFWFRKPLRRRRSVACFQAPFWASHTVGLAPHRGVFAARNRWTLFSPRVRGWSAADWNHHTPHDRRILMLSLLFGWPFLSCWVLGIQYSNVGGRISMCMHVLLAKDLIWHGFFAPVRAKARTQGIFWEQFWNVSWFEATHFFCNDFLSLNVHCCK